MALLCLRINNAALSIVLTISTVCLLTVNGCEIQYYESDITTSFCHKEMRKHNILKKLYLDKEPERVNSHNIPNEHPVFEMFKKKFDIWGLDETSAVFFVLFPSHVEKSGLQLTMTFELSELPEELKMRRSAEDVTIEFHTYDTNRETQYIVESHDEYGKRWSASSTSDPFTKWASLGITDTGSEWYFRPNESRKIVIKCNENCNYDAIPITTNIAKYPYMLIRNEGRGIILNDTCFRSKDVRGCSRKTVHMDFAADFGWGKWMVSPKKYNYSYCSGYCSYTGERCLRYKVYSAPFIYWQDDVLVADLASDMDVRECYCLY